MFVQPRSRAALVVLAATIFPGLAVAAPVLDLAALLRHAAKQNPELKAAHARWQGTRHASVAARQWPEPTVSGGVFLRPVETRVGPQRARIGLTVPVPWPARLRLRGDAVLGQAVVERRRIDARLARLEAQIRGPWARRSWLAQVAGWYAAQRRLLVNLEPSVLARLRVGRATFADAQRLRLMIDGLADQVASARDEIVAVEAELRARANLPVDAQLAAGGFEADPFAGNAPPTAEAFLPALAKQPDVLVGDAAIAAASAGIRVAETRGRPDFGVGIDWIMVGAARMADVADSGNDALMLRASVKLPVWRGSYDAQVDVARAKRREATASREATLRSAEARLAKLLYVLRDARRKRHLFAGQLVPRAQSALLTVVQGYVNGRAAFQSVVELQRQLLVYQVGLSTADRRRVEAQAQLEALLAAPLGSFAAQKNTPAKKPTAKHSAEKNKEVSR